MFHPCFRLSLQKGVKYIAMADLAICILCATLRFGVFYDQEQPHNKMDSQQDISNDNLTSNLKPTKIEFISLNPNKTNTWDITTDEVSKTTTSVATTSVPTPKETKSSSKHDALENKIHKIATDHFAMILIFVLIGFVVYLCDILLEVWLCRLLMGASSKRDSSACKQWFWIRLTLTVVGFVVSMFGIFTFNNDWVDYVLDSLTIYRIYELFVVNEFRKEILATSGVVRFGA